MKRVLVVDDNQAAADGIVRLLTAIGYETRALYSGKELMEQYAEGMADLFFIDIGMPEMDGHETVAALRARGYAGPVVALTGYGQLEDKERASGAGFTAHLTKPVGVQEFRTVLEELLA